MLEDGFQKGKVDNTLFRKTLKNDILIVQVYINDITFGSTNASLCQDFSKTMQDEFEISMRGEVNLFLDILINQCKKGVYVHHTKYINELLKKFKLDDYKIISTPMHPTCNLSK